MTSDRQQSSGDIKQNNRCKALRLIANRHERKGSIEVWTVRSCYCSPRDVTVCFNHEQVYGRVLKRGFPLKCCDIFNTHKKRTKGHHVITLEIAKILRCIDMT